MMMESKPKPKIPAEANKFKGNFCCFLPGLALAYSPRGIFFSPAYVVYDNATRRRIREAYIELGYTHMPLNLTNHDTIYREFYPQWNDSQINVFLSELLEDGIIPVGFVMGGNDTEVKCKADQALVPIVVPKWEDSSPIKGPSFDKHNTFYLVKEKYPNALLYWHNPPYQGAPYVEFHDWGLPQGDPAINARVWNFMVGQCGVKGLLFQGKAWESSAEDSINSLNDFSLRLGTGFHGWPKADLIDFEETAYYLFNLNGNQKQASAWTNKIRSQVKLKGFCNG